MEPDFSGFATMPGIKCSDGRTIAKDAFAHEQQPMTVPLVWAHGHDDPELILGHAKLEPRDGGMYCYGYFNENPKAIATKKVVQHGDVTSLSIYANQLAEKSKQVFHGIIREVSLVLAGANPEARIDNVRLAHGDDPLDAIMLEDDVIVRMQIPLEHTGISTDPKETVEHAADDAEGKKMADVYATLNADQEELVHMLVMDALEAGKADDSAQHSDDTDSVSTEGDKPEEKDSEGDKPDETDSEGDKPEEKPEEKDSEGDKPDETDAEVQHDTISEGGLAHQEGTNMTRNVFDQDAASSVDESKRLTHDQLVTIVENAKKPGGSFKDAVLAHADEYGITDINLLFPDAKALTTTPEFISRRMEWVSTVLNGTKHSPFAKVKTLLADITEPEARAKGYIKGNRKKEEVFKLLRRTTGPATIYKKQKLDRDDMLDITDIDVVNWLKAEMRLMIEEELARAILVGDGRSSLDEDKVKDPEGATDGVGIRSILHDDPLYAVRRELAANVSPKDAVKGLVRARGKYRGSGKPTLFISDNFLTDIMLEEDKFGRALYETEQALADKLRVKEIVPVDLFDEYPGVVAILVSLQDYTIGSNRGGELTNFEDFDIDFNQHKYLQETRLSGGLTKPFSAVVVTRGEGTLAVPQAPDFDGATNTVTVPTVTGISYFNAVTDEEMTGDTVITGPVEVEARPDAGYYMAANTTDSWTYTP